MPRYAEDSSSTPEIRFVRSRANTAISAIRGSRRRTAPGLPPAAIAASRPTGASVQSTRKTHSIGPSRAFGWTPWATHSPSSVDKRSPANWQASSTASSVASAATFAARGAGSPAISIAIVGGTEYQA